MGFDLSGLFGGDDEEVSLPSVPEYYTSPEYVETQNVLKGVAYNTLAGEFPEYYKPIGEYGGEDFENILGSIRSDVTTDVSRSVQEDLTRRGVSRGGLGTAATSMAVAEAMGDIESNLRYSDYERALDARGDLFGIGVSTLADVRTSALSEQNAYNQYQLGGFSGQLKSYQQQQEGAEDEGEWWGQLLGVGSSLVSSYLSNNSNSSGSDASSLINWDTASVYDMSGDLTQYTAN